MEQKIDQLRIVLESMMLDDITISARATVRTSNGLFKNASDITRNPSRRACLDMFVERQNAIRNSVRGNEKSSALSLRKSNASKDCQISRLVEERDLLISSHRAMLHSIASLGGIRTWEKFFRERSDALRKLDDMGAIPGNVISLSHLRNALSEMSGREDELE